MKICLKYYYDCLYRLHITVITLQIPAEVEVVKTFWCGICTSGPLYLKVKIPQTGFVPGQAIPIRTEIVNSSNVKATEISFYLRKLITYRADTPGADYKEETVDLARKSYGNVSPKGSTNFEETLMVPAVPPTSQFQSKIIQINYDIKVEVELSGGHTNPFVLCPITIGTVPLFTSSQQPMGLPYGVDMDGSQSHSAPASSYFQNNAALSNTEAPLSLPVIAPVYNRAPSTPNSNLRK